jgi:serine phosphatase RsbU (regulator of sigma subunit)/tetratricopeptide (TPR) repeat protein
LLENSYIRRMNFASVRIVFIFILLFSGSSVLGQQKSNSEKEWLIDYYFPIENSTNSSLTKIYDLTILGKYDDAKKVIAKLRKNAKVSLDLAATMTYEGNIAYNESRYARSIELCDSAILLLKKDLTHRYVLRAMNYKAKALGALNEYDEANAILDTVMLIAAETKDDFNLSAAYYYYGSIYSDLGDYKTCVRYVKKSVDIRKKIGDQLGLAASYSFMGLCYAGLDNYTLAIEYIQKSIPIREKAGDKRGLANSYLTMYKVYFELGELDKAMESEFKSLKICQELKDLQCVSGRYTNLGQLYQKKGQYKDALNYHFKALSLSTQLQIKNRIALVHENIARVYALTNRRDQALLHLDSSLVLRKEIGDVEGETSTYLVMADIYLEKQEPAKTIEFAQIALRSAKKLQIRSMEKEAHQLLSKAFEALNKPNEALFHFREFVHLKDSLFSIDQSKELVRQELEFNFAQKEEKQRLEQEKKEEKARMESRKQRNIILSAGAALVVLSLLLGFSIWQYRLKNRSKQELELTNAKLNTKNEELEESKEIIEIQHREITDSIRYARQIQYAILPSHTDLKEYFTEAFVIFKPKDVISGDFYWATSIDQKTILATVDCTGHGVPGGFMSMLGISLLNELVIEQGIISPALLLHKLREKVITSLRQKGNEGEQKDGMDMTVCVFDKNTSMLTYAAANHVFYLASGNEITEYKGDRHPVGIFGDELLPFHEFTISVKKGDRIYTFTDGFPDQFGGPKGKKYKYQQLKDKISNVQAEKLDEQGNLLDIDFTNWQGALEQIDDVTVIGVEI